MPVYYNENEPFCADWLRRLIAAGLIADGVVDDRSITQVKPDDLRGFEQCHFFAGVGVWSYALRQAGWDDDRPVWTGSCPCQPFSASGKRTTFNDRRHLFPVWADLIRECQPAVLFGEQVASPDGLDWWDLVHAEFEDQGYAAAATDLCGPSVGAPHIRQRLYWVAERERGSYPEPPARLADALCAGRKGRRGDQDPRLRLASEGGLAADVDEASRAAWDGATAGFWQGADWVRDRDGNWRPVEPGTQPLADGTPSRVDLLRAYGNALIAPLAETFIKSYMDTISV